MGVKYAIVKWCTQLATKHSTIFNVKNIIKKKFFKMNKDKKINRCYLSKY
jgi:hypothetical protein